MNKISKRIVAGASAAALLVSAVGIDQLSDLFMKTSYADSTSTSTRNGKSTGFNNLEQDTTIGNTAYNTGYGLHTNKTATEVGSDGRTFDVDLESWYVGENPVDVATILDASGSMAWTVDTLEPLEIDYETCFATYNATHSGMGEIHSLTDLQKIQEDNDGYLPQDVIDCILNPKNTDNSKLSYADYMYYIYESRSSVSEFVPLGYWDGGVGVEELSDPLNNKNLLGYYNFNDNLKNSKDSDKSASYIEQATEGGSFDEDKIITTTPQAVFKDGYLDLSETDKNGNLVIDLSDKLDVSKDITISFTLKCDKLDSAKVPQTPIFYLGDGTNTNYLSLMRGRCSDNGTAASNHLYLSSKSSNLNIKDSDTGNNYAIYKSKKENGKTVDDYNYYGKDNIKGSLAIKKTASGYDITLVYGENTFNYSCNDLFNFSSDKLYFVLGGDEILPKGSLNGNIEGETKDKEVINPTDLKGNYIKDVTISGTSSDSTTDFNETFALTSADGLTSGDLKAEYKKQLTIGASELSQDPQDPVPDSAVYQDNALNLTKTAEKGAILLDAAPKNDDSFTLSFKVKKSNNDSDTTPEENILYIGSNDTNKTYYRIYRDDTGSSNRLKMSKNVGSNGYANINNVFSNGKDYSLITIVVDGNKVTQYVDGKLYTESESPEELDRPISNYITDTEKLSLILGGLWANDYIGSDILIDDLYVFDCALSRNEVNTYFSGDTCAASTEKSPKTHARTVVTTDEKADKKEVIDIAQIANGDNRLGQNTNADELRGWYYVNSASDWNDISGCLESGKQYIGIYDSGENKEADKDKTGLYVNSAGKDIATVPSGAYSDLQKAIEDGNTDKKDTTNENKKFKESPTKERSIRFYVDTQGHLRCFAWSGSTSKATDIRTFCSLVYEKGENSDGSKQITKYEALNDALNGFYKQLAEGSDLSNSAIVRFSTNKAVDNLDMLIMKDWTNWSEFYQGLTEDEKKDTNNKSKYMADLLIPADGETSTYTTTSTAQKIEEYPYVMTGGTYTWTGLKSFYDNMVNKESGRVYDIANDARDKYLIIFTDGRDNLVDSTATNYEDYLPEGITPTNSDGSTITDVHDGDLAKAWADKLKSEGYTIFCVMMAAGSISKDANPDEYDKAKAFVTSLAGEKVNDKNAEKYVSVIGAGAGEEGSVNNVSDAFQNILNQIQQPRADYTVQDYIDPRFDLVDKNDNIYHLGAGGKITVTDKDGKPITTELKLSDGSTFTNGNAVGNIIDNINDTTVKGLAYTPRKSEMVNRKAISGGYDNGDGVGTGYIYYDNIKDMYYLRWEDQVIPMEDEAFDTDEGKPIKYLNVWSATIRLKAKDDFIGGNNILTNGNEAGENLVYSDATIENMDKNPNLYFTESELNQYKKEVDGTVTYDIPYREKLKVLSGTDRKINAVDADGVSQAVYGDGIDIPSSGFPRTTVNVRLLKLDAKNLNDVIYMGEVVSPTMMLADLEDGYMTGSYYLEYLERYAYRLYGYDAAKTPLLELLNQWLKINDKDATEKTFTIPYIYLPDPVYEGDKLKVEDNKVVVNNNTGMSTTTVGDYTIADFSDLNLRDVTGFITYTWKRDSGSEKQQAIEGQPGKYDITKDYVVKNTEQIKYNLQLKFTPLKETADGLDGFTLDENFINADSTTGKGGDKFFNIGADGEFNTTGVTAWSIAGREDYLKAMIQETRTYEPHVMYNASAAGGGKWVLVDEDNENFTSARAVEAYEKADTTKQTTVGTYNKTVTDKGVYDWDSSYKEAPGKVQLEGEDLNTYTSTPDNVNFADAKGDNIAAGTGTAPVSLEANTTYTKDVVNAALALEIYVDGKYLQSGMPMAKRDTFTFEATRYYDDPIDPLPYDTIGTSIGADTGYSGKKYKLTFTVDEIPTDTKSDEIYRVWATLTNVEVESGTKYIPINTKPDNLLYDETIKSYLGYEKADALPIGSYLIWGGTGSSAPYNQLDTEPFQMGIDASNNPVYFKYLKVDNDHKSFTYNRFPESVSEVSADAATDTKDGKYQIWNGTTDNSSKNIAQNARKNIVGIGQNVEFYFGTDYDSDKKGVNRIEDKDKDYAKDRLGIIMLSADNNSLAISKKVDNTDKSVDKNRSWKFTVTVKPESGDATTEFNEQNTTGFKLKWYKDDALKTVEEMNEMGAYTSTVTSYPKTITFDGSGSTYTAAIYLKHDEKVVIDGLPEGTWQVTEDLGGVFCTPHNNANGLSEDEWRYQSSAKTSVNTLTPISQVDYINEFPYELPSAGGSGTVRYILLGTLLTAVGAMLFAVLYFDRRKKARK